MTAGAEKFERPIFYGIYAAATLAVFAVSDREHWTIFFGQFVASALSFVAIEWVGQRVEARRTEFPVRRPRLELVLVIVPPVIGLTLLLVSSVTDVRWIRPVALLLLLPLIPTAYLIAKRYKLREMGFVPRGLILVPIVYGLDLLAACCTVEGGAPVLRYPPGRFLEICMQGFITAALCEEVFRLLAYTRLRPFLKSTPLCLLFTSLLWSSFHFPFWYKNLDHDALRAAANIVKLIPLGLLWGYMIHRTGSLWPSVLVHMLPRPIP